MDVIQQVECGATQFAFEVDAPHRRFAKVVRALDPLVQQRQLFGQFSLRILAFAAVEHGAGGVQGGVDGTDGGAGGGGEGGVEWQQRRAEGEAGGSGRWEREGIRLEQRAGPALTELIGAIYSALQRGAIPLDHLGGLGVCTFIRDGLFAGAEVYGIIRSDQTTPAVLYGARDLIISQAQILDPQVF